MFMTVIGPKNNRRIEVFPPILRGSTGGRLRTRLASVPNTRLMVGVSGEVATSWPSLFGRAQRNDMAQLVGVGYRAHRLYEAIGGRSSSYTVLLRGFGAAIFIFSPKTRQGPPL